MPTVQIAQAIIEAPAPSRSITVLPSPRIADYWVSATRQPGGVIVFDGYVPDDATRQALSATEGADASYLKLGSGAPESYRSALDFGMAALAHLSEGRFALRTNIVTLSGIATSSDDYKALTEMLASSFPPGLVLARNEVTPPVAGAFQWTATKSADDGLALSGMVPNAEVGSQLTAAAGGSTQSITYAAGAPADFAASALAGIALMDHLETGKLSLDGAHWTLIGKAKSDADKAAIETSRAAGDLAAADWTVTVDLAVAEIAPTTPYPWSATRAADGAVSFSGLVPTDGLKKFAALRVGDKLADATTVDATAPEGFVQNVLAALDALSLLDQGTIVFNGDKWSVSGTAAAGGSADSVIAALSIAATPPDEWKIAVATPRPEIVPVERPVIAAEVPTVSEPVSPQPTTAQPVEPTIEAKASELGNADDLTICRTSLAAFSARNSILFQSGAAIIMPESEPALDELALDLAACPDVVVNIEGYTDADGDEQLNLALSVARAESVVNALITRAVVPERLYAVGYGESNPIADNTTAAGKRLNRRIVISVLDEHY